MLIQQLPTSLYSSGAFYERRPWTDMPAFEQICNLRTLNVNQLKSMIRGIHPPRIHCYCTTHSNMIQAVVDSFCDQAFHLSSVSSDEIVCLTLCYATVSNMECMNMERHPSHIH